MNWQKQQKIYERKAYRIIQDHLKKILNNIPLNNTSGVTFEYLIEGNITEDKIKAMYVDIYKTIGLDYGNKINNQLEKVTKANILFNEELLKEILLFLSNEGGLRITSVRNTLVESLIEAIKEQISVQGSLVSVRDVIYNIVYKSQQFYKWQALRIARTETTTSANFSAIVAARQSNLVLEKQWISAQDDRTRIIPYDHLDMNGQKVDLESPFFVGGENIFYPGDANASAGNTINCRCTIAFVPKRDKDGFLIRKI